MSKLVDILYSIFKIGGIIAKVIKKAKADKRKKEDEKEQADVEDILHPTDSDNG